ncbi:MAG: diguanylate cyclase [Chloroflexota bacterium]
MFDRQPIDIQRRWLKPVEMVTWMAVFLGLLLGWAMPLTVIEEQRMYVLVGVVIIYVILVFRWLIPRYGITLWINFLSVISNIIFIAWASEIYQPYGIPLYLLYLQVIIVAGIMVDFRFSLLTALSSILADMVVRFEGEGVSLLGALSESIRLIVFVLSGYLASSLFAIIRSQAAESDRHNQELALLLDVSIVSTASLDLEVTLPLLADKIAKGLPATFCRICLVDKEKQLLILYGISPLRSLEGYQTHVSEKYPLDILPAHREALESGKVVVVRRDDPVDALGEKERDLMFFNGLKSAFLVPLIVQNEYLGIISVGEARNWDREPINEEKINLVKTLAGQVAVIIHNSRLHDSTQRQVERMNVLNDVAERISSTIEMTELLELIYQQLSSVIPTDTYFVALYDKQEDVFDLRILIDGGERFPPQKVSLDQGLSSYVVREGKPLLVRNLSEEMESLPVKPKVVGKDKMSESWLGVPMVSGEHLIGMLAIASYKPYAFGDEDVALLSNVATQAALALDNARHHAEVEEQARRDSLTGVYNHGYFLKRLYEEVERASAEGTPVSLIMLDIDHFKLYNDRYGHVIGDEVLRMIVRAIQEHVKKTDAVGRWGGEEFGVVLCGATTDQARQVAERIRETLAVLPLVNGKKKSIPKPTVSQGIATYPDHAADSDELVVLADRMLYQSKGAGRDQVSVASVQKPNTD